MKAQLEQKRAEVFPLWKAALEAADGNVTKAAVAFFPDLEPKAARNKGNRLTRRFELATWAADLRKTKTGHAKGRQDR